MGKNKSVLYWIIFLAVAVGVGGYFYLSLNNTVTENLSENFEAFEFSDENGERLLSNSKLGYSLIIPDGLQHELFEQSVTLLESERVESDALYLGVSIQIRPTDIDDITNYYESEIDVLDDPGVTTSVGEQVIIGSSIVERLDIDYSNSYWPTEGGKTELYLLDKNGKSIAVLFSSPNPSELDVNRTKLIEILEDILIGA